MLEMMMGGKAKESKTGPGPQELIGYWSDGNGRETGYFGNFDKDGYPGWVTNQEIASLTKYPGDVGTIASGSAKWGKFILDGKILFMALARVARNGYWNALNTRNLVYGGRDGKGDCVVKIGNNTFHLRLCRVALTDPSSDNATNLSEWSRMIYPISSTVPVSLCENGAKWDSVTIVTSGIFVAGQETLSSDTTRSLGILGSDTLVSRTLKNTAVTSFEWRPVLELIS